MLDPTSRNRIVGRDYAGPTASRVQDLACDVGLGGSHMLGPTSRNGPGAQNMLSPESSRRKSSRASAGVQDPRMHRSPLVAGVQDLTTIASRHQNVYGNPGDYDSWGRVWQLG
jgi:hypothetical protein